MINIDNKIKEQLDGIINTMAVLQKHWYESGAIIDDEGFYDVNIIERGTRTSEFMLRYHPFDKVVELHTIGRYHDHKMVMQYSKDDGLTNFNFPLNADSRAELNSAIWGGVNTLEVVSNKAMNASPKFAITAKSLQLVEEISALRKDIMSKSIMEKGASVLGDLTKHLFMAGSKTTSNRPGIFEFSIDFSNMNDLTQFFKSSPAGEKENVLSINRRGDVAFQIPSTTDEQKVILLNQCLSEVQGTALDMVKELDRLRVLTQLPSRDFDTGPK